MSTVPTSGPMRRVEQDTPGRVAAAPPHVTDATDLRTRQSAQERERRPFYDLDRYSKYNDPLLVAGFLVVVVSVALILPPYTFPVAGVLLGAGMMRLAWMMGQGSK